MLEPELNWWDMAVFLFLMAPELVILFLVSSFGSGFFCAVVAEWKNRNRLVWFLAGCLFNVIALGVLAVTHRVKTRN